MGAGALYDEFERRHHRLYGTRLGDPAEIVNLRVTAIGVVHPIRFGTEEAELASKSAVPSSSRRVTFLEEPISVFDRNLLDPGVVIDEPCIIEEVDSTLLVPPGSIVRIDELRNVIVDVPQKTGS